MSNEIKIGLLSIITIALLLWGYKFVEGQNILKKTKILHAEYDNAAGLTAGTTVMRSGFQVGVVTNVYLNPENLRTVIVEFDVDPNLPIPKDAVAAIATVDFLGEKNIQLLFDGPCQAGNCAESGDYLLPGSKGVLASMVGSTEEVKSYVDVVSEGVGQVLDSLGQAAGNEDSAVGKVLSDVDDILQNLKVTTNSLNALIARNSREIDNIVADMNTLSTSIASRDTQIRSIITNADEVMQKLAALELDNTLKSTDAAIDQLNTTLTTANAAAGDLKLMMAQLNEGEGTLGQLLKNDQLYRNMDEAINNLDLLVEDFRLNPARYTTILRKRRPEYEKPVVDKDGELVDTGDDDK
ncbi:MAG: MlaD family protein [Bacteroidota bacterium]